MPSKPQEKLSAVSGLQKLTEKSHYEIEIYFLYAIIIWLKEGNMARVLISMSDEFLNRVDSIANSEQRTRSELIREALRSYLRKNKMSNMKNAEENAEVLSSLLDD